MILVFWDLLHAQGTTGQTVAPVTEVPAWARLREAVAAGRDSRQSWEEAGFTQLLDVLAERAGAELRGEQLMSELGIEGEVSCTADGLRAMVRIWDYVRGMGTPVAAQAPAQVAPGTAQRVAERSEWQSVRAHAQGTAPRREAAQRAAFEQLLTVLGERSGLTAGEVRLFRSHMTGAFTSAVCDDGARILVKLWEGINGGAAFAAPGQAPVAQTPAAPASEPEWLVAHRRGEANVAQTLAAQEAIIAKLVELSGVAAIGSAGNLRVIINPREGQHTRHGCEIVVRVWDWLAAGAPRSGQERDTDAVTTLRGLVTSSVEGEQREAQGLVAQQAITLLAQRAGVDSLAGVLRAGSPGWSLVGQRRLLRLWEWLASPSAATGRTTDLTPETPGQGAAPVAQAGGPSAELVERIARMRRMAEREITYGDLDWNRVTLGLLLREASVREALLADTRCGRGILHAISETQKGAGLVASEYRELLENLDDALSPLSAAERAELERLTAELQRLEARRDELARKQRGELATPTVRDNSDDTPF